EAGSAGPALLLGPLAVAPEAQGRGIGSALMRHAVAEAGLHGHDAILLVGDRAFYERFGFSPRLTCGLRLPGPVERERFLGLELERGALKGARGLVVPGAPAIAPRSKDGLSLRA